MLHASFFNELSAVEVIYISFPLQHVPSETIIRSLPKRRWQPSDNKIDSVGKPAWGEVAYMATGEIMSIHLTVSFIEQIQGEHVCWLPHLRIRNKYKHCTTQPWPTINSKLVWNSASGEDAYGSEGHCGTDEMVIKPIWLTAQKMEIFMSIKWLLMCWPRWEPSKWQHREW